MVVVSSCGSLSGCSAIRVADPLAPVKRLQQQAKPKYVIQTAPTNGKVAAAAMVPAVSLEAGRTSADIVVVGFASVTAQSGGDLAQRRVQAARAAKLDAYRNLAEQIYGVQFSSQSLVEDGQVHQDLIQTRIAGAIRGAELVSVEPLGADSYQATVRLPAKSAVP